MPTKTGSISDPRAMPSKALTVHQPQRISAIAETGTRSYLPVRSKTRTAQKQWDRGYELYVAASRAKFTGLAQEALEEELWRYSLPVMISMLRTGAIVEHCARHDRPVAIAPAAREILHFSREEREALAVDTIITALAFFTTKVLGQRDDWNPWRESASIQTYFVGALALCFPRTYEAWYRDWKGSVTATGSLYDLERVLDGLGRRGHDLDPAELVALRDTLTRILRRADQKTLAICAAVADGRTYAQIGAQLHLSVAAVEGRMYRLRKRAWEMARSGLIQAPSATGRRTAGTR
jgi:hypothetical protein